MKKLLSLALCLTLFSCSAPKPGAEAQRSDYDNSNLKTGILSYRVPGSWQRTSPTNPMRLDEMIIDPISQTKLAIYLFGKMSNTVDANLERWKNQFQEEGRQSQVTQFNLKDMPVTLMNLEGTFMQSTNMMDPKAKKNALENHSMLAAIVELNDANWFFKVVGQKPVIDSQRENFNQLINSISLQTKEN